ncbi:MAG: hypothetical protein R6T98_03565 [Desulfatiglandales bacterium]
MERLIYTYCRETFEKPGDFQNSTLFTINHKPQGTQSKDCPLGETLSLKSRFIGAMRIEQNLSASGRLPHGYVAEKTSPGSSELKKTHCL